MSYKDLQLAIWWKLGLRDGLAHIVTVAIWVITPTVIIFAGAAIAAMGWRLGMSL